MLKRISYLKDSIGQRYVGVVYDKYELEEFTLAWVETFDIENAKEKEKVLTFIKNRFDRDGDNYHITLINVMEYNQLKLTSMKDADRIFPLIDDILVEGIGRATKNGNEAHFIVVESSQLDKIRTDLGLEPRDLHITLGFDKKDVFGVSKGIDSIFKTF